jgi:hypothetical protein
MRRKRKNDASMQCEGFLREFIPITFFVLTLISDNDEWVRGRALYRHSPSTSHDLDLHGELERDRIFPGTIQELQVVFCNALGFVHTHHLI